MAQTIPATAFLPLYPSLQGTIGYRILNLDRTTATAFTTTNVVESPTGSGFYEVTNGVSAPDLGGYIYWGISGTDYGAGEISPVAGGSSLTAQNVWDALTSNLTTNGSIGKLLVTDIDTTISSRVASSAISLSGGAVTVGTNNDKTGYALSSAGVQAIWDALTSALTTVGSVGKRIADNLDAAISSRSTFSGGAVASVTGNVGGNVVGSVGSVTSGVTVSTNNDKTGYGLSSTAIQAIWDALTSALTTVGSIGKLLVTNIDAAISSRLATSGYTAPTTPPTVTQIRQEMDTNSTKLANLNDTITSRASQTSVDTVAGYVDTEVSAIKAKTDNLPSDPASATNVTSAQTAITTAISALNNLSQSQAQSAASAALSAYGAATATNVSNTQTAITTAIAALNNLSGAQAAAAIMAYVLESGKDTQTALLDLWSVIVGNSTANATDPTSVTYASPDGTTQVTHALTDTTRTHN